MMAQPDDVGEEVTGGGAVERSAPLEGVFWIHKLFL